MNSTQTTVNTTLVNSQIKPMHSMKADPPLKVNGTNDSVHVSSETKLLTTPGPNNTLSERNKSGNDCIPHSKDPTEYDGVYIERDGMVAESHLGTAEYDNMASKQNDVALEHEDVDAKTQYVTSKHNHVKAEHHGVAAEHEALVEADETTADIQLEMNPPEDDVELDSDKASAPDGGWGWFIILGCLFCRLILGGVGRSGGLFYIRFLERFNGSATSTALILSLVDFIRKSTGPFVSILCSRFTGRSLTVVGGGFLFLGLIMSAYTPNQGFLYFSYGVVIGLGRSFSLTPCPIILGHYFDKRRSLAFGVAAAGFSLGGFAITPMIELLFQWFGFQGAFLILSGFVMNVFVCSALFRPIELHRKLTAGRRKNESSRHSSTSSISRNGHCASTLDKKDLSEHALKERKKDSNNKTIKKKKRVLSVSILKDVRYLCFVIATFCFSLPATFTFLPPLATSKGITVLQAATLLSVKSGSDTVSRIVAGFVLDLKWFRSIRPQIYNLITVLKGIVLAFYPSMTTYPEFVAMAFLDGMIGGVMNAQGLVVMLDMLGVDKFASSMAYTMAVQCIAVFIGPTVSGQLKDNYGTYDGSFYFGSAAIITGGLVLAVGNIRKHIIDKQIAKQEKSQIANETDQQIAT